jgi:ATP-dependent DNA helicase RecG
MTQAEIEALVARGPEGEWTTLELKKSFAEKDAAMKTICAFLNGGGGRVLFGVTPEGKLRGMDLTDENARSIPDLFRGLQPAAHIHQERVALDNGKWVYVLQVEAGVSEQRPFQLNGRAYVRNANRTDIMPPAVFEAAVMARGTATRRWEVQPAPSSYTSTTLDHAEIRRTVTLGIQAERIPPEAEGEALDVILRNFGVLRDDGVVLNAAVVLFGRSDLLAYPQCKLRLAHFAGIDKDSDMLDAPAPQTGSVFTLIAAAEAFLRRRLPIAGRMVPGVFERQDDPVFPVGVIREALANAFAHRDYSQANGSISVAIYADRIEIINPGSLPTGWTLASLLEPHESKATNPTVAGVCYQRKLIDEWGRGTRKIHRLCIEAGHPAPEFFITPGSIGVRLKSSISLSTGAVLPSELAGLSAGHVAILRALRTGPRSVSRTVAVLTGTKAETTARNVRFFLQGLHEQGLVESPARRGPGAEWSLSELGRKAVIATASLWPDIEVGISQ